MQEITDFGVVEGSFGDLHANQIAVSADLADNGWELGDTIAVRFAETGVQQFTIVATYSENGTVGDFFVGLEAYDANVADRFDRQVLMTVADGVDIDQATAAVETAADHLRASRRAEPR